MKSALIGFLVLISWPKVVRGQTASDYYHEGLTEYQAGNWINSISYLEGAIQQNPNFWQAYQLIGYSYYGMKEIEKSIHCCKASLHIHPDNPTLQGFVDKLRARNAQKRKFTPIEIRTAGPDTRPSQDYYYNGTKLETFEQLKIVIAPIRDTQAVHFLNVSADQELTGIMMIAGGAALCLGVALYAVLATGSFQTEVSPLGQVYILHSPADLIPDWVLGGTEALAGPIGIVLELDAGQNRQNAVLRYNYLVESDSNLSMIPLTHTALPGLELTQRF